MKIYKFGGASVKDANGVRNLCEIVKQSDDNLAVVISAMGKMTNAFELVVNSFFNHKSDVEHHIQAVVDYHEAIIADLFGDQRDTIDTLVADLYAQLDEIISQRPSLSYDFEYDRIVILPIAEITTARLSSDCFTISQRLRTPLASLTDAPPNLYIFIFYNCLFRHKDKKIGFLFPI